jgi:hypothetical protein
MLQLVRDRWRIEGWLWIRDTQLHEDAHHDRSNGAGVMATLRTAALNLPRLAGYRSIHAGIQAVRHDITALLAMARSRPKPSPDQDFGSALPSDGRQVPASQFLRASSRPSQLLPNVQLSRRQRRELGITNPCSLPSSVQ